MAEKRKRGSVTVFDNWCKGCGLCVAFCPTKVFDLNGEGRPVVARPQDCVACKWCEWHCPDFAIVVTELSEEDKDAQADAGK